MYWLGILTIITIFYFSMKANQKAKEEKDERLSKDDKPRKR